MWPTAASRYDSLQILQVCSWIDVCVHLGKIGVEVAVADFGFLWECLGAEYSAHHVDRDSKYPGKPLQCLFCQLDVLRLVRGLTPLDVGEHPDAHGMGYLPGATHDGKDNTEQPYRFVALMSPTVAAMTT